MRGLRAHAALMGQVHDVALALDVARFDDEAAAAAWDNRVQLRRKGVGRTVARLKAEGWLAPGWSATLVVDALMALLGPTLFRDLTRGSGWRLADYERFLCTAASGFLAPAGMAKKGSLAPTGRRGRRAASRDLV